MISISLMVAFGAVCLFEAVLGFMVYALFFTWRESNTLEKLLIVIFGLGGLASTGMALFVLAPAWMPLMASLVAVGGKLMIAGFLAIFSSMAIVTGFIGILINLVMAKSSLVNALCICAIAFGGLFLGFSLAMGGLLILGPSLAIHAGWYSPFVP
jgi:hypothetical protein